MFNVVAPDESDPSVFAEPVLFNVSASMPAPTVSAPPVTLSILMVAASAVPVTSAAAKLNVPPCAVLPSVSVVPNATFETVNVLDEPVFVMDVTPVDPSMLNVDAAVAVIV
jgi:hypothetical protein